MKRQLELSKPIDRGNGLQQAKVEIDYIYVHEDSVTVYTKQRNSIAINMTPAMDNFIEKLEDKLKEKLETP
jgi:hypothetical protein